eukprot:14158795-Alexandrium_andersonii.AAC.1
MTARERGHRQRSPGKRGWRGAGRPQSRRARAPGGSTPHGGWSRWQRPKRHAAARAWCQRWAAVG